MKNKYYTNRHYRDTDKIRIAVNNMNKDMRELSEYCDKLENTIKELKLCNSDYYNQICTLSSKLSLINKYISNSEQELSVDSYFKFKDLYEFDFIKRIIFNKNIKLGSDDNE